MSTVSARQKPTTETAASPTLDDSVGLQRRHENVEEPQKDEDSGRDVLGHLGSAELAADVLAAAHHHDAHGQRGRRAEQRHRKGQTERINQQRQLASSTSRHASIAPQTVRPFDRRWPDTRQRLRFILLAATELISCCRPRD